MGYRKEINQFINQSTQPILELSYTEEKNPVLNWSMFRNPLKVFLNAFIITACKYLPPGLKNFPLRTFAKMKLGKNVGISTQTDFDVFYPELITIEENAILGWGVHILCHEFTWQKIRIGRVHIGRNALIGAFSTIRSGITIGENSIVAMHSFVNKDIPNEEVWGGIPAKRIRKVK